MSKALLKSMNIPKTCLLLARDFVTESIDLSRAWVVEWPFLNPNCEFVSTLLDVKKL